MIYLCCNNWRTLCSSITGRTRYTKSEKKEFEINNNNSHRGISTSAWGVQFTLLACLKSPLWGKAIKDVGPWHSITKLKGSMEKSLKSLLINYWILLKLPCICLLKKENLALDQVSLRTLFHTPLQFMLDQWHWQQSQQEIFKNFQATTVTNRFNLPLPPSLDSTYKHPWRKSWHRKVGKAPSENRPGPVHISLCGEFNL